MNIFKWTIIAYSLICLLSLSCISGNEKECHYTYDQLMKDSIPLNVTALSDTVIEVRDKVKDSSFSTGLYLFDGKKNLRFYGFFPNNDEFKYSEEYDEKGRLIKSEGNPLVEYRLFKGKKDSVVFSVFLFSLNKKYEGIELTSNMNDTIRPKYLFKSDFYSNVKCFAFALSNQRNFDSLIFYAHGSVTNLCTGLNSDFNDTTYFKGGYKISGNVSN
ncbi:MAG: hypothetical protein RIR12_1577 [Bacteroidota bacterium]